MNCQSSTQEHLAVEKIGSILDYAWRIEKGVQIGLVNIVRDNPKNLRVLPVFNTKF